MLDPSGKDVKVWNSQVLDRIDIDLLGRLAMKGRVWELDRFGYTCPEKDGNDRVLEKIGITSLGMALTQRVLLLLHSLQF